MGLNLRNKEISFSIIKLVLYIRAQKAEIGPPLGTILGNIGVNASKFCKEFNDYTIELPDYFLLKVSITVNINKTFTFSVKLPSVGFIIYLLKKEEVIKNIDGSETVLYYIFLEDLLKLSLFKFQNEPLINSTKVIMGSLKSSNIKLKY